MVNPEQIIYLTYQLRQAEIYRNDSKKEGEKGAMTLRIRNLKAELDPLLEAYAEEKKQTKMVVDRDLGDVDLGPPEVLKSLHTYAKMKTFQSEVVDHLQKEPVSIAGEHNGVMYIIHFEQTKKGV